MAKFTRRRKVMYNKQGGRCIYCGKLMWIQGFHKQGKETRMCTVEHIVPQIEGGGHEDSNLACSCSLCNSTRSSIDHFKFMKIRQKTNWQQLAKEEKWKTMGIYYKKKRELYVTKICKKHPKLKKILNKFKYEHRKFRRNTVPVKVMIYNTLLSIQNSIAA